MISSLTEWFNHRTGYRRFFSLMLIEHIPGGARWRYVWGSCLAFVFAIQLITGVLLMTAYSPSDTSAWGSVYFIQYQMDFGWLIRGLHHFGSQTMVVLLAIHMVQVVIAGAQLPPREVNWWLGILLLAVTLGLSLTGYLLPWDQKGFYATQVATNIAKDLPVIGEPLCEFLVGGPEYGTPTLTRFFTLHVWVLPFTLIGLVVLHLVTFRRHGVTAPRFRPEDALRFPVVGFIRDVILGALMFAVCWFFHLSLVTCGLIGGVFWMFAASRFITRPKETGWFYPDQAFRDLLVCLFIFGVMVSLCVFGNHGNPIERPEGAPEQGFYEYWAKAGQRGLGANLDAPADRETSSYPARPEWYFLFLFQLLKYFPGDQKLIGTVVIPNGAIALLAVLPLLGYGRMRKFGHAFGILVVVGILGAAAALTLLAIADDSVEPYPFGKPEPFALPARDKEVRKAFHHQQEEAEKQAKLAVNMAASGIPVEGARDMMRGPIRFQVACAGCHSYTPSDPHTVSFNDPDVKYTAGDLFDYGSEKWIRGLLENPGDDKYFGRTDQNGMKGWRRKYEKNRAEAMKNDPGAGVKMDADLGTIAKFLAQQKLPTERRDKELQTAGLKLFETQCMKCHPFGDKADADSAPDLTDYASQNWIAFMIEAPDHPLRYGEHNKMPAFRDFDAKDGKLRKREFDELNKDRKVPPPTQLSDTDRDLIVRFITRNNRALFGK